MNEFEKAAIIGHWRNGATIEEISKITGWIESAVKKVIEEYKLKTKNK